MLPFRLKPLVSVCLVCFGASSHALTIGQIQGEHHLSAYEGQTVGGVDGIVTAVDARGFWMQDVLPDGNALTSDGIYVFTNSRGRPSIGDRVLVSGRVDEYRPGGAATNLTVTELNASFGTNAWAVQSRGNALPTAIQIGNGGLLAPTTAIAPAVGNVETSGLRLAPTLYAMDFYESLEGMRVSMGSAAVVGPNVKYGEIAVIAQDQLGATLTNARGGATVARDNFNPQRLILDDALSMTPIVNVGDALANVTGVMHYSFSNYKLNLTEAPTVTRGNLLPEVVAPMAPNRLAIASYNVENLAGNAAQSRFDNIAGQIVGTLGSPQLIALQEVQDNNGATDNGTTASDQTLDRLTQAVRDAGGRDYGYVVIDPRNKADGGQPGGNIRNAYLYDKSVVSFAGAVGGATEAVGVLSDGTLTFDAGRVDPTNPAFDDSRKPLAAQFRINGESFILVNNHFSSKGGDEPLFGPDQVPTRGSEVARTEQAQAVANFVGDLLSADPGAALIVLGDLNDFQFADTLAPLTAAGLINLTDTLPESERYTYIYEGNSQALDHMFVSAALLANGSLSYDIVHANAEFANQISDHDPLLLTIAMPVPEPETYALMMLGLGVVGAIGRRRRRALSAR
ncbi:endonuclease/exonuclease/phosphatase family protein [Denitromonas ohlonensis]|uniref:PEP-CTERM sorting domain-containing protein n=2 Tax=Denitromonas TaxID=139331 RepID=A0A557SJ54_9RHOO|nr:endonuclease/exonuclease/phosphatase family protein [Denitromonas ohlonensis]TVO69357.1 PEP-CTERM sorting domain-containing protein [Denitromonas ohlonensis]TVO77457.1 PEP-CTERM sorting domain-containing protein [Denitromonas ohlonensis]